MSRTPTTSESNSTAAVFITRLTDAEATPATPRSARSTAPEHVAHVMPSMSSVTPSSRRGPDSSNAASNPRSSTASTRSPASHCAGSYSTSARPVRSDTAALRTPGTPSSPVSTDVEHAAHVMPPTVRRHTAVVGP